jgi:hypothetical protein
VLETANHIGVSTFHCDLLATAWAGGLTQPAIKISLSTATGQGDSLSVNLVIHSVGRSR